ncbi:MAG TPA: glycoside hydrolase family 88 protein [bacterium]|nr:glycoside hydrolase family 88 protein [bacterium]
MMATATDLGQLLRRAADRTVSFPYKRWGFGEAVAMLGLLAASRAAGDDRYRSAVVAGFDRWWSARRGTLGFADHVTPGLALLSLARRDRRWMPAALALGRLFARAPVLHGVPVHRPDLDRFRSHVWVDCLYTDGAFLALLGLETGDDQWSDLACAHTRAYVEVLWDASSGLFCHGYDAETRRANAVHWGRGNGWALMGLVDLLRFLPTAQEFRRTLADVIGRQVEAMVRLQDASGHWHTVVDRPETYLESSVAAMMAWAVPQAVRLGAVPAGLRETALTAAASARAAALTATDPEGNLTGVSEATPAEDLATYATRPTGVYPWGQGPLLLALADAIAPDSVWEVVP